MTNETTLLSCPFCGGEARTSNERFERTLLLWVYCSSCGAAAGYRGTEAEAIAAWNTRTERVDKRETVNKTGDFVTHNSQAERTCKMETDYAELEAIASSHEDTWAYKCSACDWLFRYNRGIKPNYCPNCGAKVVSE